MTVLPLHALALVVEDDGLQRLQASGMFADAGYDVLEAGDADQAMRLLEANAQIRLLFTDVGMPSRMNGSQLALCVTERWPAIGIIVVSGQPRPAALPSNVRFHGKPYSEAAVLSQARDMTQPGR
jgi:CheY-like chemotaxis protein